MELVDTRDCISSRVFREFSNPVQLAACGFESHTGYQSGVKFAKVLFRFEDMTQSILNSTQEISGCYNREFKGSTLQGVNICNLV